MLKVLVLLQIAALSKYDDLRASRRSERGSVTMEHVLWAVAVIGIVALAVVGVGFFLPSKFEVQRSVVIQAPPGSAESGLKLVALSDAPRNAAELRLKWLGLG